MMIIQIKDLLFFFLFNYDYFFFCGGKGGGVKSGQGRGTKQGEEQ